MGAAVALGFSGARAAAEPVGAAPGNLRFPRRARVVYDGRSFRVGVQSRSKRVKKCSACNQFNIENGQVYAYTDLHAPIIAQWGMQAALEQQQRLCASCLDFNPAVAAQR